MAHIYGKYGESALQKALEKREKTLWGILLVFIYTAMGMGVLEGMMFSKSTLVRLFAFVAIFIRSRIVFRIGLFVHPSGWLSSGSVHTQSTPSSLPRAIPNAIAAG